MLKFKQIRLENFIVYEDAALDFAVDGRATVIRAENGSGKTTLLRALEWAVYGDSALPGGTKYRVHPPSLPSPLHEPVEVSVELDVELDEGEAATIRRSTLVSPDESSQGGWRRSVATADFSWASGRKGHEEELETRLPWRLREFFFTDGDKATDYVGGIDDEDAVSTSFHSSGSGLRGNVTDAIKSLLGLDLLESVRMKAKKVSKELDKQLAAAAGNAALGEASANVEEAERYRDELESSIIEAQGERAALEQKIDDLQQQRDRLLQQGDPSELEARLKREESRLEKAKKQLAASSRQQAMSLTTASLTYEAGRKCFEDFLARAEPLVTSGVVPATYLWWVRRRLDEGVCMCGCTLDPEGGQEAHERHDAVTSLIERSEEESRAANHAGDLYYHVSAQLEGIRHASWIDELRAVRQQEQEATSELGESEREVEMIREKLSALEQTQIAALREHIATLTTRDHELDKKIGGFELELQRAESDLTSKQRLLTAARKKAHAAGDLTIKAGLYEDVLQVLTSAIKVRTNDDVTRLTNRMNELFQQMIGNHQVIREVRVTQGPGGFEVEGIGQDGLRMDVAHQFNGASKRALTNAFVLALGETAGVSAPNVIDTPLGMMDLSVRRRVFEIMQAESSQLVMLLTRSEIVGIEEALDSAAVQTVTNMGSGDAVADLEGMHSIVCSCTHREYCDVCERAGDHESHVLTRRAA